MEVSARGRFARAAGSVQPVVVVRGIFRGVALHRTVNGGFQFLSSEGRRQVVAPKVAARRWISGSSVRSTNAVAGSRERKPASTDSPGIPGRRCSQTITSNAGTSGSIKVGRELVEQLGTVAHGHDLVTLAAQILRQVTEQGPVVFRHQHTQ